jgi:hypothetical protein
MKDLVFTASLTVRDRIGAAGAAWRFAATGHEVAAYRKRKGDASP